MQRYSVNGPLVEPLGLAETKLWLRVDHGDDDALIQALIKAARERVEARTGRALMAQTWRIVLSAWPKEARVALPIIPVQSVVAVRVFDGANAAAVLASTTYALERGSEPAVIAIVNPPNPGRSRNGIEIDVVAGYGVLPGDCPEPLRQAMRYLVLKAYGSRGPERASDSSDDLVEQAEALLAPYRQLKFGRSLLEGIA